MNSLIVTAIERKEEEIVTLKQYDEEHHLNLYDYLDQDVYGDTESWRKWLAVDDDGEIYAFSEEPHIVDGYWFKSSSRDKMEFVGTIPFRPQNYEKLLIRIKETLPIGTIVIFDLGDLIYRCKGDNFCSGVIHKVTPEEVLLQQGGYAYVCKCIHPDSHKEVAFFMNIEHIIMAVCAKTGEQLTVSDYR